MKASLYEEMSSYVKHFLRLTYFSFNTGIPDKKTPKEQYVSSVWKENGLHLNTV